MTNLKDKAIKVLGKGMATDIVSFDMPKGNSHGVESFVIATANNARHIRTLGDEIKRVFKTEFRHEEPSEVWYLANLGSVIVHIFSPDARAAYALEDVWQRSGARDNEAG